jgi:hypothetical protein
MILIGSPDDDIRDICMSRINGDLPTVKVNLMVHLTMGASKEYFAPISEENSPLELDMERLHSFVNTVYMWAKDTFGGNLLSLVMHADEQKPHMHALVQPLLPTGRLHLRSIFPGSDSFSKLHTNYANALSQLGIFRPYKGKVYRSGNHPFSYYPHIENVQNSLPLPDFCTLYPEVFNNIPRTGLFQKNAILEYMRDSISFIVDQHKQNIVEDLEKITYNCNMLEKENESMMALDRKSVV